MKIKFILLFSFVLIFSHLSSVPFRLMTYNSLNYDGADRTSYFIEVISEVNPDIIVMQEVKNETAANTMLTALQTIHPDFAKATFWNDGDQNNMLFYRSSIASLLSQSAIDTYPRDILEYKLSIDGNPLYVYSCHLKASDGSTNEAQRYAAVSTLRTHLETLPANSEFIIAGDMNIYTHLEDAYQKFIADEANNAGRAIDLYTGIGNWHENYDLRYAHTQSTRTTAFGGGATGGLDDRFDFIFSNYELNNGSGIDYVTDSYTNFGNDGNHFNTSIIDGANSVVSAAIASALHQASDHLPVYADFTTTTNDISYCLLSEYIEGSAYNKAIEIFNGTGTDVNLANYSLEKDTNGDNSFGDTYSLSGTISNNDVFVVVHTTADAAIQNVADATTFTVLNFNGNDQVRLLYNGVEVDRIGISGGIDFGKDVTYVRKTEITLPQSGEQDPRSNGEWTAYPQDTFSYLGWHSQILPLVADFSVDETEITLGSTVAFTNLTSGGLAPYTYSWDFNNDGTVDSIEENPSYTYSGAGTYSVSLSVTDSNSKTNDTEIKIDYITVLPSGVPTVLLQEEFNSNLGSFSQVSITGTQIWESANFGNPLPCAKMSGYSSGYFENEDWLISPVLDFTNYSNITLDFDEAINYEYEPIADNEEIMVSTDYAGSGNPNTNGTWSELTISGRASGSNWTFVSVNQIDLNTYAGEPTIYIAFKYTSSSTNAATWEIDNVIVQGETTPLSADFSADETEITLGSTVTFTNLTSGGLAPYTYSWDFNNDGTVDSVEENPSYSYSEAGTYTVSLSVTDSQSKETDTEIKIDYITVLPSGVPTVILQEEFNSNLGSFNQVSITGTQIWESANFGNPLPCAKMSGYSSGYFENEDWLISPVLDFTNYSNITLDFDEAINYEYEPIADNEEIMVSTDYAGSGNPNTNGTWSELTISGRASGSNWTFVSVDQIDLNTYAGEPTIYIAFKYTSSSTNAATWEIDNVLVNGEETIIPQLDPPQNVHITIDGGGTVTITWDAVINATSYRVEESDTPEGIYTPSTGTFNGEQWTGATSDLKKFYQVIAE